MALKNGLTHSARVNGTAAVTCLRCTSLIQLNHRHTLPSGLVCYLSSQTLRVYGSVYFEVEWVFSRLRLQLEVSGPLPAPVKRVAEAARRDVEILAVALYGSYTRGENSAISDIDICIYLASKPLNAEETHRKRMEYTEVAADDKADVQVFQQLPLYVRPTVLREGRMVLVKDGAALYDLAWETIKEFEDFRKHYEEYLAGVAHGESG